MCATCGCATAAPRQTRLIQVERNILDKNDRIARFNRGYFAARRTLCLNLVSSPGSGKTTLLERTLGDLHAQIPLAVIEGDQRTDLDARRIAATGVPVLQLNTGKGCHLDAQMIRDAMPTLRPPQNGILLIENVGNLVCPAAFDLGEAARVVLASVTEGEEKPLKYPDMFATSALMLVSKADLLPHLDFDVDQLARNARRVRPDIDIIVLSAKTGQGMAAWYGWLRAQMQAIAPPAPRTSVPAASPS